MAETKTSEGQDRQFRELVIVDLRVPEAAALLADLTEQQQAGRFIGTVLVQSNDDGLSLAAARGLSTPNYAKNEK